MLAATPPVMIEQFSFDEFRPKSWSQVRSETWCMFIFKEKKIRNIHRVVHFEFVPRGETVSQEF